MRWDNPERCFLPTNRDTFRYFNAGSDSLRTSIDRRRTRCHQRRSHMTEYSRFGTAGETRGRTRRTTLGAQSNTRTHRVSKSCKHLTAHSSPVQDVEHTIECRTRPCRDGREVPQKDALWSHGGNGHDAVFPTGIEKEGMGQKISGSRF